MNIRTGAKYLLWRNRSFFGTALAFTLICALGLSMGWLHSDVIIVAGLFFILVLGLDLLYGCAGMLSFGHVGFFAIGAYSVAVASASHGLPLFIGTGAGLLINIVLSYVLGRICLNLSSSYFMLGTLAFGIMVHSILVAAYPLTGGDAGLGGIPRPVVMGQALDTDGRFGALLAGVAAVLLWVTLNLSKSRLGRAMKAIRSDAVAAACLGADVKRIKINAFVISACYASLSGALFAMYFGAVHPDSFSLSVLLNSLLMLFVGGVGSIWGALFGASFISVLPDLVGPLHAAKDLFNGIIFSLIIFFFPAGLAGALQILVIDRWRARSRHDESDAVPSVLDTESLRFNEAGNALALQGVSKAFGGVRAVEAVFTEARGGIVKALIGPNGAGKSTLMNLVSGVLKSDSGTVTLGGIILTGRRPDQIAHCGVQRTFQHEKLFKHLNVLENVMVGNDRAANGTLSEFLRDALALPSALREEEASRASAMSWLRRLGLEAYSSASVDGVPQGMRKLIEVARACAARPHVLLLDETAAGLNDKERASFKQIVRLLRSYGMTIILIEHDIDLVMELADEVCVINFGQVIADSTPDQVRRDPRVVSAYLGD